VAVVWPVACQLAPAWQPVVAGAVGCSCSGGCGGEPRGLRQDSTGGLLLLRMEWQVRSGAVEFWVFTVRLVGFWRSVRMRTLLFALHWGQRTCLQDFSSSVGAAAGCVPVAAVQLVGWRQVVRCLAAWEGFRSCVRFCCLASRPVCHTAQLWPCAKVSHCPVLIFGRSRAPAVGAWWGKAGPWATESCQVREEMRAVHGAQAMLTALWLE
jgi:hypothetical protein